METTPISLPKSKSFVQLQLFVLPCVEIVVLRPPVCHFTVLLLLFRCVHLFICNSCALGLYSS